MMATIDRADLARLIEAYGHLPEASQGAPMLSVRMTPQAALWLMDIAGTHDIEAEVIMPPESMGLIDAPMIPARGRV